MTEGSSGRGLSGTALVMIEVPKGSRNKYEYDPAKKVIMFNRMLFSAVHYPSDYGFVLDTLAEDGDPLDALVLVWEPTFPGCVLEAKPVGMLRMRDEMGLDLKLLCVPVADPNWNFIETLDDVPPHLLKEIYNFFSIYKELESKETVMYGWEDRDSALNAIADSRERLPEKPGGGAGLRRRLFANSPVFNTHTEQRIENPLGG